MNFKLNDKGIRVHCSGEECSFKPVSLMTVEYMYCTECKCEVTEGLVDYKAKEKAAKAVKSLDYEDTDAWYNSTELNNNKRNYIDDSDDGGQDDLFYPYDLFMD
jgi:hypothetical protein